MKTSRRGKTPKQADVDAQIPSTWPEIGTQDDWAPILRKKPSWFEMARHRGNGPTYTLVGRKPMYLREDILAYLLSRRRVWTGE